MSHQPDLVHQITRKTDPITHQNIIIYSITVVIRSTRTKNQNTLSTEKFSQQKILRQVRSFSFTGLQRYAFHLLLDCVHMQRDFCSTADPRTVYSVVLRTVTAGTHPETLSRHVLQLRDAVIEPIAPRTFTVRTHLSFFFPAHRRNSPFSALRTHAGILILRCIPTQLAFLCSAYPHTFSSLHLRPCGHR